MDAAAETGAEPWFGDVKDPGERARLMCQAAAGLDDEPQETMRRDMNDFHARLFDSSPLATSDQYGGKYFATGNGVYTGFNLGDISTWNVARSVVMTAASMIGKNKPRARLVTTAGDYRAKHRAAKGNQFCAGWAQEAGLYPLTFEALVDALSQDIGAVQVLIEGRKVKVQRVLANEITYDVMDGRYGAASARTQYRRRFIARDVVMKKFGTTPARREAIKGAQSWSSITTNDPVGDILVREAWHLPDTDEDGKPVGGYHMIAIEGEGEGCELFSEPWTKSYFPVLILRYEAMRKGPYGNSLMAQLEPIQTQLNTLLMRIAKAQGLMAVPRVALERGSKIIKDEISNLIAGAITYTKTPPQALNWTAMTPEVYKWVEELVQKMYDLPGVSRNAASGVKETGTTSGAAIRESLDVQASRMETFAQAWEEFHVQIFEVALDMVADLVAEGSEEVQETTVRRRVRVGRSYTYRNYTKRTVKKKPGKYEVKYGKHLLEPLDWAKIGIDRDTYETTIYPVSNLPLTPQGRLDYVTDMLKAGLWDLTRAKLAMDDLDVESADDVSNAVARLIQKQMEDMLYDGIPQHPGELTPYDQILTTGGMYLALGQVDKAPQKNLGLIMRYLDEAKAIQKKLAAASAPPAPPPGAGAMPPGPVPPPAPGIAPLSPLPPAFPVAAAA